MAFSITINNQNVQFEEFYSQGSLGWVQAAQACQNAGCTLPTTIEAIEARIAAPNDSPVWQKWNDTTSMRITGRTQASNVSRNGGTPIVGYYHGSLQIPLEYIQQQIQGNQLVNRAVRITQDQFDAMLANSLTVDYETLRRSTSEKIPLIEALNHPQTIPFIGSRERAERYLQRFRQVYNTENIGIWHCNDLNDRSPIMRPVCLGFLYYGGLDANGDFGNSGRFFGVRASENFFPQEISQGNSSALTSTREITEAEVRLYIGTHPELISGYLARNPTALQNAIQNDIRGGAVNILAAVQASPQMKQSLEQRLRNPQPVQEPKKEEPVKNRMQLIELD